MTSHEDDGDAVLAALNDLPARDVDTRHARSLGIRCRAVLEAQTRATAAAAETGAARWTRGAGLALLAAWCAIYAVEIVRRGAAIWGL